MLIRMILQNLNTNIMMLVIKFHSNQLDPRLEQKAIIAHNL